MRVPWIAALAALPSASALMFHSEAVTKQWDTWVFVENATFYAYYLVTQVSYGEGFGVGTSSDGVHWQDHGFVWKAPSWYNVPSPSAPRQFWEGTSSVYRAADYNRTGRYLINYSQFNTLCKCQNITTAESFDLIHWSNGLEKGQPDTFPWFNIDPELYQVRGGRWDTIYSIPVDPLAQNVRDGYPRYGYWTATPINNSGTFGFGITHDGYTWKALPSPKMLPSPIGAELGAVEYVRPGVYIAMLGYGYPRTMLAYTATQPTGPFTRSPKNVNFLNGSCYYSRFFRGPTPERELLVTHQTWNNRGTHFSYVSPFKAVDVDNEGTFRLTWWPQNEKLKGAPLPLSGRANVSQGLVMEAKFTMPPADAPPGDWPGFLLENAEPGRATFVGMAPDGTAAVGLYTHQPDPTQDFNWTAGTASGPQTVPTSAPNGDDWELEHGAAKGPSRIAGSTDIRSGGPGGTGLLLVAHQLWSAGHEIAAASVSFTYASGYGCTSPAACTGPANVSLAVVDAFNHTVLATLGTSPPLNNWSYDAFKGYSPPVKIAASRLDIASGRQTMLALVLNNNKRNLQIPAGDINVTLTWGPKQSLPWSPSAVKPSFQVGERWGRDLAYEPGQVVSARLLYRRSMLEMYIDDVLYPVYAMPDASGAFGVTKAVSATSAWSMSLPANDDPGLKRADGA